MARATGIWKLVQESFSRMELMVFWLWLSCFESEVNGIFLMFSVDTADGQRLFFFNFPREREPYFATTLEFGLFSWNLLVGLKFCVGVLPMVLTRTIGTKLVVLTGAFVLPDPITVEVRKRDSTEKSRKDFSR